MRVFFTAVSTGLFRTACQRNNDTSVNSGISVRMMGAPADYDEVNLAVLDALIKDNSETDNHGWLSKGNALQVGLDKVYNLLDLRAGVNVLLVYNLVP